MNLLIDIHALIWFIIIDNEKLPAKNMQVTEKENCYFI